MDLRNFVGVALVSATFAGVPAGAQDLVYEPINPSLGGNPFNADALTFSATSQRPERTRSATAAAGGISTGAAFARQIQSRILSSLASGVVEAVTGADPGTSGDFTVGDQQIFFERSLNELRLVITDAITGETTEIIVPVLDNIITGTAAATAALQGAPGVAGELGTTSLTGGALLDSGPIEPGSGTLAPQTVTGPIN